MICQICKAAGATEIINRPAEGWELHRFVGCGHYAIVEIDNERLIYFQKTFFEKPSQPLLKKVLCENFQMP